MANNFPEPDLSGAVPRYRYARTGTEPLSNVLERLALAMSFAFDMPPPAPGDAPLLDIEVESFPTPDVVLSRTRAVGALRLSRSAQKVSQTVSRHLFFRFVEVGSITIAGRCARAGDIMIIDLAHPVELCCEGYATIDLLFGRDLLPLKARSLALHGMVLPAHDPGVAVAAAHAKSLSDNIDRLPLSLASVVMRQVVHLAGLTIHPAPLPQQSKPDLRTRAQTVVDSLIGDAGLAPSRLAEALGVSRATLYRAFAAGGGVKRFITLRRLERALTHATPEGNLGRAEVARLCGFAGAAEMDRALQSAFGRGFDAIRKASGPERMALRKEIVPLTEGSWSLRTDA